MPLEDDSAHGITQSVGLALQSFADAYQKLSPEVVIVVGDRFEILAAVLAATIAKIPVAHLHGGEVTSGAFDDSFRHAITKMSYLHFAAAEPYRRNIVQMGEHPERVFCVGAPGLEALGRTELPDKQTVEKELDFSMGSPTFVVTYHPVTLENRTSEQHIRELLQALGKFPKAECCDLGRNLFLRGL